MNSKILTLLGFAAKSGKLSFGLDTCIQSLKDKKAFLIIAAEDVSPKSLKEAAYFAQKANAEVLKVNADMFTLSNAVGRKCGIVSVNDKGFADACLKYVGGNANDQ